MMKRRFAFLLARDFSMSPLSLFVDALRLAGDEGDRSRRIAFDWQIPGERGLPIRSSCGINLLPTRAVGDPVDYDEIVVVGGLLNAVPQLSAEKEDFLMRAARLGLPITALCTGSFILARHGLLDGHDACISWFHIDEFRSAFPQINAFSDRLYIVDRGRATCAGGSGAADLALTIIARHLDEGPVRKASNILMLDRIRTTKDTQPVGELFARAKSRQVRKALLIMAGNLQGRLSVAEVATGVGVSRRHMERCFAAELGMSPSSAYTALRLHSAIRLLKVTDLQVAEVAYRCGFVSPGHFSRAVRQHTSKTPLEVRGRPGKACEKRAS